MHFDLPHEFYNLTVDEIQKEQKSRYEMCVCGCVPVCVCVCVCLCVY